MTQAEGLSEAFESLGKKRTYFIKKDGEKPRKSFGS